MKKIQLTILSIFIFFSSWAHEGMWIPSLLKIVEGDMQAEGLKLSAEDIYSINQSSLKDAIVHFGGGCTAEIVSKKGLILTNHHCGLSQIQSHSSIENDYLKNGFWAKNFTEELKNPGLTATLIVRIEDVTDKVNNGITEGMDDKLAYRKQYENMQSLTANATVGTKYEAVIKSFYYGNEFYMIVTKTFNDVRLVGAPPADIGKFGGDTDNWVWPRHTGDFSVFRIYADANNEPADVSDNNRPYVPDFALKVSMEGVKKNDFTMVFGFPGTTDQYLTSYEVADYINVINPKRIAMRTASLEVIDAAMKQSDLTRIQYTSKQARISNAHKKWIGQNLGLKEKDALGIKKEREKEFQTAVANDDKYKNLLNDLKKNQEVLIKYDLARALFIEIWYYGPEIIRMAHGYEGMLNDSYPETYRKSKESYASFFKNYNVEVDKEIFKKLMKMYVTSLDHGLRPAGVPIDAKYDAYVDNLYEKSIFCDSLKLKKFFDLPKKKLEKVLKADPVYQLSQAIFLSYKGDIEPSFFEYFLKKETLMKKYLAAQMEYFPNKKFFADANSTLRLTYGKIEGSAPRDGMKYTYYTTLDGIIQKNNTGEDDFAIPARLRELWEKKEYGNYATNGELRVCLSGSNHTTGGNSGSPALNGEGHLIGINFDRSWESTMSDILFDPSICRNIMVDIKYVLWVIDVYAGAGHLVQEMELVDEDYRANEKAKALKTDVKVFTNILRDVPSDVDAMMGRAQAYKELGMISEYENDIEAAYKLAPKNVKVLNAKASVLDEQGKETEALKILKESLTIDNTTNFEAFFLRGLINAKQGKYKEAIADFDKTISINHSHSKSYYNLGVCFNAMGNSNDAKRYFEIAKLMGNERAKSMHYLHSDFGAW
jgi:Tfp pilus assembly protein PilF